MADMQNKGKTGTEATGGARHAGGDAGKQEAHGLVDRVKEGASHLMDKAGDYAGQAGDAAKQAGHKVAEWAEDAYDATAERVGDFGKEVTTLIRRHPIPAILIGFGVGLLLGRTARMI
jgi:ElaB/YqjD/DUF883 family membrane-anchored ribosome-binding protein